MLSNALDRSKSTIRISFFESIASNALSVINTLRVSQECIALFPLRCSVRRLFLFMQDDNWFNAIRSQTFEVARSNDTGRLLCAISSSPSLGSGTTSAIFQATGKTDDNKERFTISVRIGKIQGKASLMTDIGILSHPGALSDGNDITTFCTSLLDIAWKWNLFASGIYNFGVLGNGGFRLCRSIKDCES